MSTSRNTNPELIRDDEGRDGSALPGSAAGVAGLIAPNPNVIAENELAAKIGGTSSPPSDGRERTKPLRARSWWPIALIIAIVAGVVIVSAANPDHYVRGAEPAPGSHGAEKTPGATPERAP